jgi:prepilin-type N-terminal cleavage/methylation domain-containing protein
VFDSRGRREGGYVTGGSMRQARGYGMIELLLAITIAAIVLSATMASLNTSLGLNEKAMEMVELEQNLRAGMNFMVDDFIYAGWGIPVGGIPVPSGIGAKPIVRPGPSGAFYKFDAATVAAVNPGPESGPTINNRATDIVNILYADHSLALDEFLLDSIGVDGSSVTVNPGTSISGLISIRPGDLILLSNALGSTLQYVTGVSGQTIHFSPGDDDTMNLNQPGFPGSVTELSDNSGNFPPTSAKRVYLITYYLELSEDDNVPRLVRRINNRPGNVVALVMVDLQLSYDLVDGATNPVNVKIPAAPNGPAQIRKVNLMMTGRTNVVMRETREYLRRTLTTQISLRSLSYIDRYSNL